MIFFVLSILMYFIQDFSNKQFCEYVENSSIGTALIQNSICCICASATLTVTGRVDSIKLEMLPMALFFGITYLGTVFLLLCAFMKGSMGISTLMCNIGMFIAAIYGIVRFKDGFTLFIALGFVCMLIAVILSTPTKEKGDRGGIKWFMLSLGSGLCNGIVASVKREAVAIFGENTESFLAIAFLFAGLIAAAFAFAVKKNRGDAIAVIRRPLAMIFGVFAGIGTVLANLFQMRSLITVPSTVVYPMTSGILVVSLWLASLLVYKETKAKARNVMAVVMCVIAIVFVNITI